MPSVTRLVTTADIDGPDTGRVSVVARHEAVLDDGSRVLLLDDRGWSSTQPWATLSAEHARRTTRMVVGPDEPFGDRSRADMEAGHWASLRQVLHRHGVDASEIPMVPHDVLLAPRLLARLGTR